MPHDAPAADERLGIEVVSVAFEGRDDFGFILAQGLAHRFGGKFKMPSEGRLGAIHGLARFDDLDAVQLAEDPRFALLRRKRSQRIEGAPGVRRKRGRLLLRRSGD